MKHYRTSQPICILFLIVFFSMYIDSSILAQEIKCNVNSIEQLELSSESGDLIFSVQDNSENQSLSILSLLDSFIPQTYSIINGSISPDGLQMVSRFTPDLSVNNSEIIVFARNGQVVYRGAPVIDAVSTHWLQNDKLLRLNWTRTARDSSLNSYFDFSYLIVNFSNQIYQVFRPSYDSVFYVGDNPITDYHMTFDGRYMFTDHRPIFDFAEQKPLELNNFQSGIPSSTSHRLLIVDYTSQNHLEPLEELAHPISMYDFESDETTQIATINLSQPVNFQVLDNGWSPNESKWAYVLDWFDEIRFRRIEIFHLESEKKTLTCLGQFYTTDISAFSQEEYATGISHTDFAWSRDGRYLALMGVIKGEEMEESFGLYLYDTETADIYWVHQGDADIIGWMANSE